MLYTTEQKYLDLVSKASSKYGVPVPLILAHMRQESDFDQYAYRPEPAINDASYGLMQLLLSTAKKLDSAASSMSLYDPAYNVDLGTKLIAQNLAKYGSIPDEAAAYNAGAPYKDANGKYISKSGNTAVQGYVDKISKYYNEYSDWLGAGASSFYLTNEDVFVLGFTAVSVIFILGLTYTVRRAAYV